MNCKKCNELIIPDNKCQAVFCTGWHHSDENKEYDHLGEPQTPIHTATNPPCAMCDGPHPFDTTIPSVVWNQVIRAQELPDYLCLTCIVRVFAESGRSFTAQLWSPTFNGTALEIIVNGQVANDAVIVSDENTRLRVDLSEARAALELALPVIDVEYCQVAYKVPSGEVAEKWQRDVIAARDAVRKALGDDKK